MRKPTLKSKDGTRPGTTVRFEVAIDVPVPPTVVFDYISDLENNPDWNWAVKSTTLKNARPGLGAEYLQERAWPHPSHEELRITALEHPSVLEVVANRIGGSWVRYLYELTPAGPSSTRVAVSVELPLSATARFGIQSDRTRAAVLANLQELGATLNRTSRSVEGSGVR